jgi:hypothetical protein
MPNVTERLQELRKELGRDLRPARRRSPAKRRSPRRHDARSIALGALQIMAVVALPFLAYVRTSVFTYAHSGSTWFALLAGSLVTVGIVAGYCIWFARRFRGRARVERMLRWVALPTACAWCVYSAVYLARVNAKTDDVHAYYTTVHPILRIALSTVILLDGDLVITDARRVAADYPRMGLPVNNRTRHYQQPDGWVHAVDLRTRGHNEFANRAVQFYFWSMGFSTLRHVGTADHLHVQLRPSS